MLLCDAKNKQGSWPRSFALCWINFYNFSLFPLEDGLPLGLVPSKLVVC